MTKQMFKGAGFRRIAFTVLACVLVAGAAAALTAWTGLYSVAASRGHWPIVRSILEFGMRRSVATHAMGISVPLLDDPDLIRLGAAHFHSGCAFCHGAPGRPISPIVRQMLPPPPNLTEAVGDWRDRDLFWIVKHGLKYTGMPGWPAFEREDEVWSVVAFLKRLRSLDEDSYRDLALGEVAVAPLSGREIAITGPGAEALGACARCHGREKRPPKSALVPILHGQREAFLIAALQAYAAGTRRSGIMQPVASDLEPEALRRLARYYAGLQPPDRTAPPVPADALEAGRKLALDGDLSNAIPACMACHGNDALPTYPRLAGQQTAYTVGRLKRWKKGGAPETAAGAIMAPIAARMTDAQIDAVAAYFASLDAARPASSARP